MGSPIFYQPLPTKTLQQRWQEARELLGYLGYENVRVCTGDGSLGWPEEAPYDAIVVTAASPEVPTPLKEQLADGGRLLVPVGPRWTQHLVRVRRRAGRHGEDAFETETLIGVAFVPLIGEHGWQQRGSVRK